MQLIALVPTRAAQLEKSAQTGHRFVQWQRPRAHALQSAPGWEEEAGSPHFSATHSLPVEAASDGGDATATAALCAAAQRCCAARSSHHEAVSETTASTLSSYAHGGGGTALLGLLATAAAFLGGSGGDGGLSTELASTKVPPACKT